MFGLGSAELVALGGVLGAGLGKLLDMFLSRHKTDLDAANKRMDAIIEANQKLTQNLFQNIEVLTRSLTEVNHKLEVCEAQHRETHQAQAAMRAELEALRAEQRRRAH